MLEIESISIQISTNHTRFASPNGGSSAEGGEGGCLSLECHLTPKLHALRKKEKPSLDREGVDEVDGWDD